MFVLCVCVLCTSPCCPGNHALKEGGCGFWSCSCGSAGSLWRVPGTLPPFIDVWCDGKFCAHYCKSTRALNVSEFCLNHTLKLSELFFHIRVWRYKGYIFLSLCSTLQHPLSVFSYCIYRVWCRYEDIVINICVYICKYVILYCK